MLSQRSEVPQPPLSLARSLEEIQLKLIRFSSLETLERDNSGVGVVL